MSPSASKKSGRQHSPPADSGPRRSDPQRAPARRTQAERTATSDARLLEAALKLIGQRGFRATTLAAIGEEAGYSRGLVSHRYGSKEGLLAALAEQVIATWEADHGLNTSASGFDGRIGVAGLCAIIDAVAQELESRPQELLALNAVLFDPTPELRATAAKLHAGLRTTAADLLRAGIEAGETRANIDVNSQAALFVAGLRGALYQWTLDQAALDMATVFHAMRESLRTTLAVEDKAPAPDK